MSDMRASAIGVLQVVVAVWTAAVVLALVGLGWVVLTGRSLEVVATGSMAPTIPTGSLAIIEPVGPGRVDVAEIETGDVITYRMPGVERLVMHRVEGVVDQGTGPFFRTKGDANEVVDARAVPSGDVDGRLQWSVPMVGRVLWALRPPLGLVLLVGVPALLTVVSEAAGRRRGTRREPESGGQPWEHGHRHGVAEPDRDAVVSASSVSPSPRSAWR